MTVRSDESAQVNLVCFPWGGGGSSAFCTWKKLPMPANIYALKLPGREGRLFDEPILDAKELVDQLAQAMVIASDLPCVFYGHSMGAGLAMQMLIRLYKTNSTLPSLLIASGRQAPNTMASNPIAHLTDEQLLTFLQTQGAIAKALPKNAAFLKHYLPKIKADYTLNSSITELAAVKLPVPIALLNGLDDQLVDENCINMWSDYSSYELHEKILPGNHFFMLENMPVFLCIAADLINYYCRF